jgi:type III secretory pathway component EscR
MHVHLGSDYLAKFSSADLDKLGESYRRRIRRRIYYVGAILLLATAYSLARGDAYLTGLLAWLPFISAVVIASIWLVVGMIYIIRLYDVLAETCNRGVLELKQSYGKGEG